MPKNEIAAGLDMGGGRITAVVTERDCETGAVKVLSGASAPCRGLKSGVVVDIKETSNTVARLIEQCERDAGAEVETVCLGVRGAHLKSANGHGAYNIARADKEITSEDVHSVIENAKAFPLESDKEILHVLPQGFSIDRQKGVPNPEGMEGSLLEVDVHIVSASSSHLNNLIKSVAKAGFAVEEPFYSLITLGECALTPEEKELGALLIDFGGETTSIALYHEGGIKFSRDLPYGCDLITRDIAYGLHTSREGAREIKEKYGSAWPAMMTDDEEIPVPGLDGRAVHNVKPSFLLEIIQPRAEEILEKVREEIEKTRYADIPGVGAITGGGSLLKGLPELCCQSLSLREARRAGVQRSLACGDEKFFHPSYGSALSLAVYPAIRTDNITERPVSRRSPLEKVCGLFKGLEIFGRD
ncbi:MAG: cell division protein FtsA [Elusimicrobiales bacterium]